jgi:hypothetical protein
MAPMSALLATLLALGTPLPWRGYPLATATAPEPERLAQLRRPTDGSGEPTEPGGLPSRSDRSEDARPTTRGFVKPKKAAPDKDKDSGKDKGVDRSKKEAK